MLDLERALLDIRAMRHQIARGTEFRGYGPAAFAITGGLAFATAWAQAWLIERPEADVLAYICLWGGAAILSAVLVGIEVVARSRRVHSGLADEMIQTAVEQLLPAMAAGGLLTIVLVHFAPASLWMLPGLWQVLLALGVFASCRCLPAPLKAVGVWYLASGLACLAVANGEAAFSPLAMGLPFGCGQLLAAILIHRFGVRDADA